jgi:hypothetical protein
MLLQRILQTSLRLPEDLVGNIVVAGDATCLGVLLQKISTTSAR